MKTYSLINRLKLITAGIMLTILIMPVSFYSYFSITGEHAKKEKVVELVGEISSKKISEFLIRKDTYSAGGLVNTICNSLSMAKCQIVDDHGKVLFQQENQVLEKNGLGVIDLELIYIGKHVGKLRFFYERVNFVKLLKSQAPILMLLLLLFPLVYMLLQRTLMITLREMDDFFQIFEQSSLKETIHKLEDSEISCLELESLKNNLTQKMKSLDSSEERLRESEKKASLGELARQLVHDIRSPLAALNMITADLNSLPENRRVMLRSAINRIHDIANNLLEKNKGKARVDNITEVYLLSPIIESMISEKRTQLRGNMGLEIQANLQASYGLFSKVDQSHLKRILSNLINNSTEAMSAGSGKIEVILSSEGNQAKVVVKDNGQGIAPEVLEQLESVGGSFGKEDQKDAGHGLGLSHAKKYVEIWGGSLAINSTLGEGTEVIISLPLAKKPSWFVPQIEIDPSLKIIVLDDDSTIHQVWENRFKEFSFESKGIEVLHFSDPYYLMEWANKNGTEDAIFLCDYEFVGLSSTGLTVIEELGIAKQSLLITSRSEERAILEKCQLLGVGLIPKMMAEFVPLKVNSSAQEFDLIHVDDDELVRQVWRFKAEQSDKNILSVASIDELQEKLGTIAKGTPFYIDSCLGENLPPGELLAKDLYEQGFSDLYISTGLDDLKERPMPWIKEVIGKEPPSFGA